MKKILLSLSTLIVLGTAANAQISFAPEVGLNISNLREKVGGETIDGAKMRIGGKVGGVVNIGIINHLSVQPGLFFSMKGGNYKYSETVGPITAEYDSKTNLNYLELPVNVVYSFGEDHDGFFVFAGPYVGYALGGKMKQTVGGVSEDEDVKFGSDKGEAKRLDVGANAGVGYMLPMGLYFRAQYGLGLANIENEGDSDNYRKNAAIGISVGFRFGK